MRIIIWSRKSRPTKNEYRLHNEALQDDTISPQIIRKKLRRTKRVGGAVGVSVLVLPAKSWLNKKLYRLTAS